MYTKTNKSTGEKNSPNKARIKNGNVASQAIVLHFEGGGERKGIVGIVVGMVGIEGIVVGMVGTGLAGRGGSVTLGIVGMVGNVGTWVLGNGGNVDFGRVG